MTKINLLRNFGRGTQTNYPGTQAEFQVSSGSPGSGPLLAKLFIGLILPAVLIYYEHDNLEVHRNQLGRLQKELDVSEAELTSKASTAEVLKQYVNEKAKLENQMEAVRQLNKTRLREIKALDSLQSMTPAKVWLNHVTIQGKIMTILASSMTSDDISAFIQRLGESAFFSDVLLTSTTEESSKGGSFKKFEVHCKVEAN
jgi:Tfp pilus assembly protein PilN